MYCSRCYNDKTSNVNRNNNYLSVLQHLFYESGTEIYKHHTNC